MLWENMSRSTVLKTENMITLDQSMIVVNHFCPHALQIEIDADALTVRVGKIIYIDQKACKYKLKTKLSKS